MSSLTHQFDEQGYVTIRPFLDGDAMKELQAETRRFVCDLVPTLPGNSVYYERKDNVSTLKQVLHVHRHYEYFDRLARSDKVMCLAEELLGGAAELREMQYFRKAPHTGAATPAHQDGYYFAIRPHNALTMWLSLGYADAANGAVCYIPKSHKTGVRPHSITGTLGFSQGISDWSKADQDACVQIEAAPGDLLVHHCLTIHSANPNISDRERASFGLVFYAANVKVDEKARAAYQASLNASLKHKSRI